MKDVIGYEGLYAVTSCGRVWSYGSKKFLKPKISSCGYEEVTLYDKSHIKKSHFVHRLVAEAYIPNADGLPQVNHIDEIKTHNWIKNLEWVSAKQNKTHSTGQKVQCIETGEIFNSLSEASRLKGLSRSALFNYFSYGYKTCGGYTWRKL